MTFDRRLYPLNTSEQQKTTVPEFLDSPSSQRKSYKFGSQMGRNQLYPMDLCAYT